jgi:DNA-binding GntR family transcriptional regulator
VIPTSASRTDTTQFSLSLHARPERLTGVVYDAILQAIVDRRIPPGARITEVGLAGQLGVSKTPVREALLKLRQVGVIEMEGARTLRVVSPSRAAIRDAYEAREALEVFAARKAAERASPSQIETIREAARRSLDAARAGDQDEFRRQDGLFHRAIGEAAANDKVTELVDDVITLIRTLRQRDLPHIAASIDCGEAHTRIAEAVAGRDADLAAHEMREHIRRVQGYVTEAAVGFDTYPDPRG